MTRWTRWYRRRVSPEVDRSIVNQQGRKLLGALMEDLKRSGHLQGVRHHTLPDGTRIVARFDGTTPTLTVESPQEVTLPVQEWNLWVPRGFVVMPARVENPYGAGLPVVSDVFDTDPYVQKNLSPGLDWNRWTDDGALGEALLSRDLDAGYPDAVLAVAPLLYHDTMGPYFVWDGAGNFDLRPDDGPYQAFRIEFDPPPSTDKAGMFEQINARRVTLGRDPLVLWPRGYFRRGQAKADILNDTGVFAHHSQAFPDTYQTSYELGAKDGYPTDMSIGINTPPPPTDPFPGEPDPYPDFTTILAYGRAHVAGDSENIAEGVSDPDEAFDAWLASPPHKANIEDSNWNGYRTLFDGGINADKYVQGFSRRSRWIETGNGQFHSERPEIPPLTWHTFANLSLAWETWPVGFDDSSGHLFKLNNFTVPETTSGDLGGGCVFSYLRTPNTDPTDDDNPSDKQDATLGRHLFMRGRAIALAPRGGLILGAGITRPEGATADRFIALVHHPEDQPADWRDGMTRYLRVWYCDVAVRDLLANPQQTICGEADDDYNTLPWLGGELIDMAIMPDAPVPELETSDLTGLKYSSLWRFSPDGSRAVALRDFQSVAQYEDGFANRPEDQSSIYFGGFPRGVELVFDQDDEHALTTDVNWLPFPSGAIRSVDGIPGVPLPEDASITEYNPVPLAVDYNDAGDVIYAWHSQFVFDAGTVGIPIRLNLAGVGDISVVGMEDCTYVVPVSTSEGLPEPVFDLFASVGAPAVADVVNGAFVVDGFHTRFVRDSSYSNTGASAQNPDYEPCKTFTADPVHGVMQYHRGELVNADWYACPDGVIFQTWDLCDANAPPGGRGLFFLELLNSAARMMQCYYARRGDDWLFSYVLSPQPGLVPVRDDDTPDVGSVDCGCQTSFDDWTLRSHLMAPGELNPRGGNWAASFDVPTDLAADWLLSTKVV